MGLAKSASPKPTARSMARLGARSTPSVMIWLRRGSVMGPPGWKTMIPRRVTSLDLNRHLVGERDVVGQVAHVLLVQEGDDDGHHRLSSLVGKGVPHVEAH